MNETKLILDMLQDLIAEAKEGLQYSEKVKVVIPQYVKKAAERGLKIRESLPPSKRCCTKVGLARADQLIKGENLSLRTLKRMKSFAARHGGQTDWANLDVESKRAQSFLLWGQEPTKKGSERFIKWVDSQIAKFEK